MDAKQLDDDYLKTLEEAKKQYQQYVEVSKLYELPTKQDEPQVQHRTPSPQHPLTTNRIRTN